MAKQDSEVEVVLGCYAGRKGKVVDSAYIPVLEQNLYTICTSENEMIRCPSNELKIIRE